MQYSPESAAERAMFCATLVVSQLKDRDPDRDDVRALAGCVAELAAAFRLRNLPPNTDAAKNLRYLLKDPGVLTPRYRKEMDDYFREIEGDNVDVDAQ
ncbi:MAG TPA: hypothetical protein VEJ63_08620 [Planctomycetota bacterium]|nr:hypothetical protein [Planctomycetota bacterium]